MLGLGEPLPIELMLRMGVLDCRILKALKASAREVFEIIQDDLKHPRDQMELPPVVFRTNLGRLHQGDCLALMQHMESDSIDVIFADPPFNLKKLYPSGVNDDLKEAKYLEWCESWAGECARLLKPGGSLFFWNIPKWSTHIAGYLNGRLTFRHWIVARYQIQPPYSGPTLSISLLSAILLQRRKAEHFSPGPVADGNLPRM